MNDFSLYGFLKEYNHLELFIILLIQNSLIVVAVVIAGLKIDHLSWDEVMPKRDRKWLVSTLLFNTAITLIGAELFLLKIISFDYATSYRIVTDTFALIFVMDFSMFVFHYLVHKFEAIFPIHQLHHTHVETTATSLFILHPLEVLGFGFIWLGVLWVWDWNIFGVVIYLAFNIIWGTLGHIKSIKFDFKSSIFTNTTFHQRHHQNQSANFGFYFSIWDTIFRTNY